MILEHADLHPHYHSSSFQMGDTKSESKIPKIYQYVDTANDAYVFKLEFNVYIQDHKGECLDPYCKIEEKYTEYEHSTVDDIQGYFGAEIDFDIVEQQIASSRRVDLKDIDPLSVLNEYWYHGDGKCGCVCRKILKSVVLQRLENK